MPSIRNISMNVKAGQTEEFPIRGDGLRLVSASVPIYFKEQNGDVDFYLEQGEQAIFDEKVFKRLQVYHLSGTDQQIIITVSEGSRFNGAKISGSVSISSLVPTQATGASVQATVTNASTQLVAANAARKYLLIQNNDPTGVIYVAVGAAATLLNGVKIPAGGSYELNCNILTGVINAIGSIASNANVVVVTG